MDGEHNQLEDCWDCVGIELPNDDALDRNEAVDMFGSEVSEMWAISDVEDSDKNVPGSLDLKIVFSEAVSENSLRDFIEDLNNFSWEEDQLVVEQLVKFIEVQSI